MTCKENQHNYQNPIQKPISGWVLTCTKCGEQI